MAFAFTTDDLSADYSKLINAIIDLGEKVSPRGLETYEVEDAVIYLTSPRNSLPIGQGRKYSRGILSAELMQWLSGTSDLKQLTSVSKGRFLNYSDDGERLYGAYGPRAYSTLDRAVRKLAEDPDSRQAVAVIWGGEEIDETKDLPCTLSWGFRIRDGGLHMSTTMRSNDIWRGLTYDVTCMTRIGSIVAWSLGLELTHYAHYAHSLHLYASDLDEFRELKPINSGQDGQPPMLSDFLDEDIATINADDFSKRTPIERFRFARDVLAVEAMDGVDPMPRSFEWYTATLRAASRNRHFCASCRCWLPKREVLCPATL